MKLLHLSDLHLGKRLIEVSLLEDQAYILQQIANIAAAKQVDAVLIAGDVYDRSLPPAEATQLFSRFIHRLTAQGMKVFIISGNHDSAERLAYFRELVQDQGVYISPVYDGHIEPVTLTDPYGEVCFWLMPYVHPDQVRRFFPDDEITCANDAARLVLGEMQPDPGKRHVILSHQLILRSEMGGSERKVIGTVEDVDASLYNAFDYAALGHIHKPQNIGRADGTMRYCGTPLKYARDEAAAEKSVTVVELREKGSVTVHTVPLTPMRETRVVKGAFAELLANGPDVGAEDDYYFIILTDDNDIPNAAAQLRECFGRVLGLEFDNLRTRSGSTVEISAAAAEEKTPLQLLSELYRLMYKTDLPQAAQTYAAQMIARLEEDDA